MKNLKNFVKKTINESKTNFTYTFSLNPIEMDIAINSAVWTSEDDDEFDLLGYGVDATEILEENPYGYLNIEGGVLFNDDYDSDFVIKIDFDYRKSEVDDYVTEISCRKDIPSEYYPHLINALCSKDSPLYDISEIISEFKYDIIDAWK